MELNSKILELERRRIPLPAFFAIVILAMLLLRIMVASVRFVDLLLAVRQGELRGGAGRGGLLRWEEGRRVKSESSSEGLILLG